MSAEYKTGDVIRYGSEGLCIIEDVQELDFTMSGSRRCYYVLKPISSTGNRIYVPKDNRELIARFQYCLGKQDIDKILDGIDAASLEWISDRRLRSAYFAEVIQRADQRELLEMVCSLYARKAQLSKDRKALSYTDKAFLGKAEQIITDEFAYALNLDADEVGVYIMKRLGVYEDASKE